MSYRLAIGLGIDLIGMKKEAVTTTNRLFSFMVVPRGTETSVDEVIGLVQGAMNRYGKMEEVLTDRGFVFYSWHGVNRFEGFGPAIFQAMLEKRQADCHR